MSFCKGFRHFPERPSASPTEELAINARALLLPVHLWKVE